MPECVPVCGASVCAMCVCVCFSYPIYLIIRYKGARREVQLSGQIGIYIYSIYIFRFDYHYLAQYAMVTGHQRLLIDCLDSAGREEEVEEVEKTEDRRRSLFGRRRS